MSCIRRGGQVVSPLPEERCVFPLFLSVVLLLLSGCSRTSHPTSATVTAKEITPQPLHVGPNKITFHILDGTKPVAGARVILEGDMTHAGMAPVFGDVREIAPGQYQGQLVFDMAGDWVVLMHISLPNGQKLEEQMDVGGIQSK